MLIFYIGSGVASPESRSGAEVLTHTFLDKSMEWKARSEFYPLLTEYQIENFWQTSGLNPKGERTSLNEVFTAKDPKESNEKMDSFVAGIGEQMKKYQPV